MITWNTFHQKNPYAGFPEDRYHLDIQGWNFQHPIFDRMIQDIKPSLILEVGSWKGGSAIAMANTIQRLGINCKIICIDTWLGSTEFWDQSDTTRYGYLNLKHGYPQVYPQFIANVIKSKCHDIIIPLPTTSSIGARLLKKHEIQADLIYIDASHEYEDVCVDLRNYSQLLAPHGAMFGDDFVDHWPGVQQAVREFSQDKMTVIDNNFWSIP